jgi:divalent metal cation (Fe/Co/Zn/Cd) transporter
VIHESKNPALFSIVLEDFADLVGLVIAFLGLALSHALNMPRIDAVAAIAIGVLLGAIAFVLLVETHGLLIGEAAGPRVLADVCSIATNVPGVVKATSPSSLHFGPDDVVVAMWVQFDHALDADEVAQRVALIEQRIRGEHPEVRHVYLQSGPLAETR